MFEDFLNHRCDIYHLVERQPTAAYGIRPGKITEWEQEPSLTDVPCHFQVSQYDSVQIVQGEPYSRVSGETKLTLPYGTDIRMNDKVRDRKTGLAYRADVPKEVQQHHIIVTIRREEGVKGAI